MIDENELKEMQRIYERAHRTCPDCGQDARDGLELIAEVRSLRSDLMLAAARQEQLRVEAKNAAYEARKALAKEIVIYTGANEWRESRFLYPNPSNHVELMGLLDEIVRLTRVEPETIDAWLAEGQEKRK